MSTVLCLEAFGPSYVHALELVDHSYLSVVIERYKNVQQLAAQLAACGWRTEVHQAFGAYVICRPPTDSPLNTEADLRNLLHVQGIDVGDYGFFDDEDDFDPNNFVDGDVSIDDWDTCSDHEEEFESIHVIPLMSKEVAEELAGKKIEVVDLIENHKVVMHLGDGKRLTYDDDNFCFTLE